MQELNKIYLVQNKKNFWESIGKPHYSLVKAILDEYIKEKTICRGIYYPPYLEIWRVYPGIYNPTIESFLGNDLT